MFRPGDMVAFTSASNACVLSQQPQGAIIMTSQLECVSLQLLQESQHIPSWWKTQRKTTWNGWYLSSSVLSCTVLSICSAIIFATCCKWTSVQLWNYNSFWSGMYAQTKNAKETFPGQLFVLTIPGSLLYSGAWMLNFVSKICDVFHFHCLLKDAWITFLDTNSSHLPGLSCMSSRNDCFPTMHLVQWFVQSVCFFLSIFINCLGWILLTLVG